MFFPVAFFVHFQGTTEIGFACVGVAHFHIHLSQVGEHKGF